MDRDYFIKSGDEYLTWVEKGTEPAGGAAKLVERYKDPKYPLHWILVDGHKWSWVGMQSLASKFTWEEARNIIWNKLKTRSHVGWQFGRRAKPRPDRWRYKLVRIVPRGDKIRPKNKR